MPYTKSKSLHIYFSDKGTGEPALFYMPGWCDSRTGFEKFQQACSKHRRVITLDWRGHGKSDKPNGDFGFDELVQDASSVIYASGVRDFIPVSVTNAGWVAIELLRRFKKRIPRVIFTDWVVLRPPQSYIEMLTALQDHGQFQSVKDNLLSSWLNGVKNKDVEKLVRETMMTFNEEMWSRAAREISKMYNLYSSPIHSINLPAKNTHIIHIYSLPNDTGFLESQENFASGHSWFTVLKINTQSHFFTLEQPKETAELIEKFISSKSTSSFYKKIV